MKGFATLAACLFFVALPALAQSLMAVPSGQAMVPYEALWEDHVQEDGTRETWLILRFLAPEISKIGGRIDFAGAEPDLDFLCASVGLPLARMTGGGVDQIIVTLLEKPLARGVRDAHVTKYMSAYRVSGQTCEWEG